MEGPWQQPCRAPDTDRKITLGQRGAAAADAFRFYTKTKTVTSRWPSGIKGTGEGKAMVLVFKSGPHHIDSRE